MDIKKIGIRPSSGPNPFTNVKAQQSNVDIQQERQNIPDAIFQYDYSIFGVEYSLNIRKLLEIDVTELSELTIGNLRVQIEQISSIRATILKAKEQLKESFSLWRVNYEIWWAGAKEIGRDLHWAEQKRIQTKHSLAASAMKAPTENDVLSAILVNEKLATEYKGWKEEEARFEKELNTYTGIDSILNSREFDLNRILETRTKQSG